MALFCSRICLKFSIKNVFLSSLQDSLSSFTGFWFVGPYISLLDPKCLFWKRYHFAQLTISDNGILELFPKIIQLADNIYYDVCLCALSLAVVKASVKDQAPPRAQAKVNSGGLC